VSGPDRRGWVTEPQSLTVASIASRRAGRCSDLACGTGIHPIHHGTRIRHHVREAGRTSGRAGAASAPWRDPWLAPWRDPWRAPWRHPWRAPSRDPWLAPWRDPWPAPWRDPWPAPWRDPWPAPSRDPSTSPAPASSFTSDNRPFRGAFGLSGGFWGRSGTKSSREPKSTPIRRTTERSYTTANTGTRPGRGEHRSSSVTPS
jgi:hypothetical protein